MNRKTWLTAVGVTLLVAMSIVVTSRFATGHFSWGTPEIPKAQCEALTADSIPPVLKSALTLRYQERVAAAIIREPQNTWSNLAVDVAMMGWTVFAIGCFGYSSVRRVPSVPIWVGVVGGGFAITAAVFRNDVKIAGVKPFDTTYVTVAGIAFVFLLLVASLFIGAKNRPAARPSFIRLVLLALTTATAIACQIGDRPGNCFCRPESLIQAHAVWHVLMGFAAAQAYDLFAAIEGKPPLFGRTT
jgi:hypothetical protein